jgi:hypothetical protein
MGMFDEFAVDLHCPTCQQEIKLLQTKATSCSLEIYKPNDPIWFGQWTDGHSDIFIKQGLIEAYEFCQQCDARSIYHLEIVDNCWTGKLVLKEVKTREQRAKEGSR